MLFYVLFVCKCVLYCCHWVTNKIAVYKYININISISNVEAIQLLDNMGIVRRLQRKKTFCASLSDSVKAEIMLVQVLVQEQTQC